VPHDGSHIDISIPPGEHLHVSGLTLDVHTATRGVALVRASVGPAVSKAVTCA
jgi:hypothetical protein